MAETNTTVRIINSKGLSRYRPKFDGSKISHLPIDRVYPTYVHYGKSKEKPTYPDAIGSCL